MTHTLWFVLGLALLALELFTPGGFYLFVFGLSGIVLGLLLLVGIPLGGWTQGIVYAVVSVVLLVTIRRQLASKLMANTRNVSDEFSGKEVLLRHDIPPGEKGEGELRGTVWQVRNTGTQRLTAGSRCIIDKAEGLTLLVSNRQN